MAQFDTKRNKLPYCWNLLQKNITSLNAVLLLKSNILRDVNFGKCKPSSENILLDLSSDWIIPNQSGDDYYYNFQIEFEQIVESVIPFIQGHFVYVIGDENSEIIPEDTIIDGFETNEVVQIFDVDITNMKRVLWNKSFHYNSSFAPFFKVKLMAYLYNPIVLD